jgi:hypothetical protein
MLPIVGGPRTIQRGMVPHRTLFGRADLTDAPRFLVTDALHGESGRVIEAWSFRWAAELLHEFSKQGTGLAAAQGRNEEAAKYHCRLSCLAQSLLQRAPAVASTSEGLAFAKGGSPLGNATQRSGARSSTSYYPLPNASLPMAIPVSKWPRY